MEAWSRLRDEVVDHLAQDWLTAWRMKFGVPLGDPRLESITLEQAQLDVLLHERWHNPKAQEQKERDEWFAQHAGDERQPEATLASEAGNVDEEAALAELERIKARKAQAWDPDGTYVVESLDG